METTRAPVPLELLKLRSATAAYVAIVRDLVPWAEQVADINRIIRPEYGNLLDELRAALLPHEMGTPAAIDRVVGELLEARL
jgi:hypothetical protein